jgi:hypothetical protein
MVDENTTAESPAQAQNAPDKAWLKARAADKEAREKALAEKAEREATHPNKPFDYILCRHMARSPRTRTMRAARAGHRRQGVLLDDGSRIRKKGRGRLTPISIDVFVHNHARLLEYVRVGSIEFLNPATQERIPYAELEQIAKSWCDSVKAEFSTESKVPQDPVLGSDRPDNTAPTDYVAPLLEDDGTPADLPPDLEDLPPEDEDKPSYTEADLKKMSREELNTLAEESGIKDPAGMPNKGAVIEAILAGGE